MSSDRTRPARARAVTVPNFRRASTWLAGGAAVAVAASVAATLLLALSASPAKAAPPTEAGADAAPSGSGLQLRVIPSVQSRVGSAPANGLAPGQPPAEWGSGLLAQALVTDYFLTSSLLGPRVSGGFRATGGLLAPRSQWGGTAFDALPGRATEAGAPLAYLGIGYTGLSLGAGWGLQADLGLVASGALRLGRSPAPAIAADELMRELRLSPVLRIGASYSF